MLGLEVQDYESQGLHIQVVHQQMDSIRSNFFWQRAKDKSKYHMVKWDQLCIPKDFGSLGIMNTRTMNEALLSRWVWRMLKADIEDICYNLLKGTGERS